jgi:hypothetical protein
MKRNSELALTALAHLAPVPGVGLLLNPKVRRNARRIAGLALLGAGAALAVPVTLFVICKTSPRKDS